MPHSHLRRHAIPEVVEAKWYTCPECRGNTAIPCGHCGGRGVTLCGPALHKGTGAKEWPEAGGFLVTCTNCGSSFIQVAENASQNGADALKVGD